MRRLVLTFAVAWSVGCQASPPERNVAHRAVPPDVLARFELDDPELPATLEPLHVLGASSAADAEGIDAPAASIELEDVFRSVDQHFPLILAAEEEIEIAEGRLLEARGGFDTRLGSVGRSDFEGFYQNEQFGIGIEQPTALWGASFSGGYRYGGGDFPTYEGGDKTNDGGELNLGLRLPLLQNRAIDPRRVAVWRARIARDRADPFVEAKRLDATRTAADAYWKWVAAGRLREVAVRLLALAEDRIEQIRLAVEEGLLAPVNLTENQRLIVDRRARLVSAERGLQEAAIALSLYWRDAEGRPAVPDDSALPYEFPAPRDAVDVVLPDDEGFALDHRPEVQSVTLQLEGLDLERSLAENSWLPRLDLGVKASQDFGAPVNTPDDKGELELGAYLSLEVPIQRREARGVVRRLEGEIAQLEREAGFLREVIVTEVQDARSALTQAWLRIAQQRENVRLANELADAERFQLSEGQSDLLRVNLREQQAAVAAASFVEVLREYFRALTAYRAVLGIHSEDERGGFPPVEERRVDA